MFDEIKENKVFVIDQYDEIVVIDLDTDVYLVEKERRDIVFHTKQGKCKYIRTFREIEKLLQRLGYEKLDRGKMTNINTVTDIDADMKIAKFDNGKQTTISKKDMKRIQKDGLLSRFLK
ncbi:LytTR family transcriptional regulator DNA-binding domain-containing protein [Paenibacillus dendritiformis]|uniref:LytTR family transcriptional regulator DNA-binding domain-containing protein n=1 Tax=Paenibacillus dendritiformis TaxID=130049 RepID=UPI0015EC6E9E|nr:LytTR family transcriptional regulator DNA-binding domain-containing protein [Paenibacillus dendritiformis]